MAELLQTDERHQRLGQVSHSSIWRRRGRRLTPDSAQARVIRGGKYAFETTRYFFICKSISWYLIAVNPQGLQFTSVGIQHSTKIPTWVNWQSTRSPNYNFIHIHELFLCIVIDSFLKPHMCGQHFEPKWIKRCGMSLVLRMQQEGQKESSYRERLLLKRVGRLRMQVYDMFVTKISKMNIGDYF